MLAELYNLPSRQKAHDNLPFRTQPQSYVCTHDTQPPDGQNIRTDQSTLALIRIVKRREVSANGIPKSAIVKIGKRPLDSGGVAAAEDRIAKKHNSGAAAGALKTGVPGGSSQHPVTWTADELKSKTVPQLKDLLRALSLAVSGTKDELVRRLVDHQRANKYK